MPDLRDKQKAKARARKHRPKGPGNPNQLPNNEVPAGAGLPDDIARDVSNEGVQYDPAKREQRLNP
jgi:hypothetical protein